MSRIRYRRYRGQQAHILNSVTDASGVVTSYTYNSSNDYLTNVSSSGSEVDYTYSYGKLVSISHNTDSNSANDVTYNFVYDEFGNTSSVKVGTQALITHTYGANNGLLTQSTYGNGVTYTPTYDSLDRITAVSYNGVEKYNWVYGADGNIGLHNDLVNDVTWRYEYTKDGSLTSAYASNGERFDYTYDTATGKLLSATVSDGETSKTVTYNYSDHTNGEKANLIESVVLPTGTVEYSYDGFYRASYDINVDGTDILSTHYAFLDGAETNSTTLIPCFIENTGNNWNDMLSYTYDSKGNIETVVRNGLDDVKYYYDDLNQLVREDNWALGKTIAYTYDNGGNIQSVNEYSITEVSDLSTCTPIKSNTYTYGDGNWKDKLTSYNGNAITYDEIGNPLTYYNGLTFEWQNGRQLASVSGNGLDISYTYDANGIRTSKTVNGVTTTYTIEGSNVVKETNGTDTLWYYYDALDTLTGFELNGTSYFYVKNLQGDIIAITDASGNVVVEYVYDSWGKLISTAGSLASTVGVKNPFRYRGYYYDTEIGLYYLQSRYYDSNIKRLLNVDCAIGQIGNVQSHNMFAYAFNCPIMYSDPTGEFAIFAAVFMFAATAAVATFAVATIAAAEGAGITAGITAHSVARNLLRAVAATVTMGLVTSAATSTSTNVTTSPQNNGNHSVYVLQDDEGNVEYVGRTTNVLRRKAAHEANPARSHLHFKVIQDNLNYSQARALEQAGMIYYHTINTQNKMNNQINGISPKYWETFKAVAIGALEYEWNRMTNEILYWTGN